MFVEFYTKVMNVNVFIKKLAKYVLIVCGNDGKDCDNFDDNFDWNLLMYGDDDGDDDDGNC